MPVHVISSCSTHANVVSRFVQFYLGLENYLYFSATSSTSACLGCPTRADIFQALCWYDYFLTLDREIKFIWKAEQSLATILFYFYRYPGLLNFIIELLGRMSWHNWQTDAVSVIPSFLDQVDQPRTYRGQTMELSTDC